VRTPRSVAGQESAPAAMGALASSERVENKMGRGGYTPHENGRLSKERRCGRSIAQVLEKKSGCAMCFWAFLAVKVGDVPSPPSAEHAKEAVPPACFS
jgi:hypothetical protein